MSEQASYSDFDISGDTSRKFLYVLALSFCYSSRFNYRRLESHTHAIWNLVLDDLLAGLSAHAFSVPQLNVTSSAQVNILSQETSLDTISPDDRKEVIPDFTGIFIAVQERKSPHLLFHQNPHTQQGFGVVPEPAIPEGYIHSQSIPRPPPFDIVNWHRLKVTAVTTLFHAELKRVAHRRHEDAGSFLKDLRWHLGAAIECSRKQAVNIFLAEPSTNVLVSIACSGEWWTFSFTARRGHKPDIAKALFADSGGVAVPLRRYPVRENRSPSSGVGKTLGQRFRKLVPYPDRGTSRALNAPPAVPEASSSVPVTSSSSTDPLHESGPPPRLRRPKIPSFMAYTPVDANLQPPEEDERFPTSNLSQAGTIVANQTSDDSDDAALQEARYHNKGTKTSPGSKEPTRRRSGRSKRWPRIIDRGQEEPFVSDIRDAVPKVDTFSKYILFGTPASNQRLYLIRKFLKQETVRLHEVHHCSNVTVPLPIEPVD